MTRAPGAIDMRRHENRDARRPWITPELKAQSTLTTVTQTASPVLMSLLFQQNSQCFDGFGNPIPC
jgi:hypothetical protein